MSDTTQDHAAAIRDWADDIEIWLGDHNLVSSRCDLIRSSVDSLAAERDALRAYARALEIAYMQVRGVPEGRVALGYIQEGHTKAVAELMAREDR